MPPSTASDMSDGTPRHTGGVSEVVDAADSLRERKKARTREAIIDAALTLFEQKGYDATTIEDISSAADVSPRTFFRYFDSKLDLVMARRDTKHSELGPLLAERPAGESLLDAMRAVLHAELDAQLADPLVLREFQVMLTTPSLRTLARDHFYEEEASIIRAVAMRLDLAEDDLTAHIIASMIASALWSTVNRWVLEGADLDRLWPMIDEAFAVLGTGLDHVTVSPPGRSGR